MRRVFGRYESKKVDRFKSVIFNSNQVKYFEKIRKRGRSMPHGLNYDNH